MNNGDVCRYIQTLDKKRFLADKFVQNGFGQTSGGYLGKGGRKKEVTQKQHFLDYYSGILNKKMPSYNRLRCPQLILYVAEAFGVPEEILNKAYKEFAESEIANRTVYKDNKDGNYFWGTDEFRQLKKTLKIGAVNRIIKEYSDIKEIKNNVARLFKTI